MRSLRSAFFKSIKSIIMVLVAAADVVAGADAVHNASLADAPARRASWVQARVQACRLYAYYACNVSDVRKHDHAGDAYDVFSWAAHLHSLLLSLTSGARA